MNYFLKCTNCGFENPLKTEYITFCEKCSKKLPDNFPEWSKLHPGKTFEDFKKEVGYIPPSALPVIKRRSSKKLTSIVISVLVLVSAAALFYFSKNNDLRGLFLPVNTPASVVNGKWERHTYGRYGMSIESPERLIKKELKVPGAYEHEVEHMESFVYHPSRGFQVLLTGVLYREGIMVNLQRAAIGSINELINQPGVSNVEFKHSPLMYNDVRGMLLDGSYHENGVFMRFLCAVYSRRSNMWSAWVTYRDDDKKGRMAAERVMESFEINYYVKTL